MMRKRINMTHGWLSVIFLAVMMCGCTAVSAEDENIKADGETGEAIALFNGENLEGWKVYGEEKWYVEDGLLVCESGPKGEYGYLGTERRFKDFDLSVDFKQDANGNSGVFFRCEIPEGVKVQGWQAEVAPPSNDEGVHPTGKIYESYGRGWLTPVPGEPPYAPLHFGDWNTMRVRVVGGHVQTWLNGEPVADLTDEVIAKAEGMIALQIHSGGGIKVRWRNIRVKEL